MFVNNEIGVIQDIPAIGALCREKGIIFHVDAAQATGKVEIDLATLPVDLMSLASHKTYGPKGIGALYVRRKPRVRLEAQMHGGGHERGMRSGTLPTHQIVGMGEAFRIAGRDGTENARASARCAAPAGRPAGHRAGLHQRPSGAARAAQPEHELQLVEGESLIMGIKGMAVSSGSACTSASLEPSYVLRALGRSDELAHSSLRMTIGRFTTEEEIDYAVVHHPQGPRRQAARALAAVGDVQGRHRHQHHPVGCTLIMSAPCRFAEDIWSNTMAYSDKVIDHYENPRNVGSFDKGDDTVGTGMVGAPACGDVMKLQIKVNPPPA
jgi:cysteine sulfinate desulfinase/cysteine desulfurase-like protein